MTDDFTLSLVVALVAAVALGGIFLMVFRAERRRKAALAALAARRGLTYDSREASGGSPARMRLDDPAGGLRLEITQPLRRNNSQSPGESVVTLPRQRLRQGLAVYAPGTMPGLGAQMAQVQGLMGSGMMQMMLAKALGPDIAPHLPSLREVTPPAGLSLTILSSADPSALPPAETIARALAALPTQSGAQPVAIVGESGITLRLSAALSRPDRIEAMLDAALALRTELDAAAR